MRILIAAVFTAIALTGCATAPQQDPFEIKPDAFNRGVVIIALDNPPDSRPSNTLGIFWFDVAQKKQVVLDSPAAKIAPIPQYAYLDLVTDDSGHNFLVGTMGEGEAAIMTHCSQDYWCMHYNAGTYHFFVKGGAYNFIGRFNDGPSYKILNDAIAAGKLPANVLEDGPVSMLDDQTLSGFTPGEERPGDRELVAAMVTKRLGHPVDIVTPTLTRTEIIMPGRPTGAAPPAGQTLPPLTAPVPPAANGDAKPASETVTWAPRP